MDAKTPQRLLEGVDVSDLAIGIQVNAQVGANRSMTMTLGAPLAMTLQDLNRYVDKIMSVAERQNMKGLLEQAKLALEGAEKNIQTNLEQRASFQGKSDLEWVASGRQGPFRPSKSQQAQLDNWDTTIRNLRDNVIPKFKRDIAELEAKIAEGV